MRRIFSVRVNVTAGIVGLLLLVLAAGAWLERGPILAWYYVLRLSQAKEADRDAWAERAAGLDSAVVPGLLGCLSRQDPRACANAQAALGRLAGRWPGSDPRLAALAERMAEMFPRVPLVGQRIVLEVEAGWFQREAKDAPGSAVCQSALRLVPLGAKSPDKEIRGRALALAGGLMHWAHRPTEVALYREVARAGLHDAEPANRALAAHLGAQPAINLVTELAPLLDDPVAEVRQAAILAVGPARDVVNTEDLLRALHDPDPDVRRLCEVMLLGDRGLRQEDVILGRLISDARPEVRLKVLDRLRPASDTEPGVWLRRLSQDPVPAVRAAALRAVAEQPLLDFSERLQQMAESDPSPTVRQLAQYYRRQPNQR